MVRFLCSRTRLRSIFAFIIVFWGIDSVSSALAQQAADTTANSAEAAGGAGGLIPLWDIISRANGFQYPILGLLVVGLFLISAKVYELYSDRRAAKELEEAEIADMDLKRITMLVANQKKSMLSDLEATMLNVFQTTKDPGTLHEEIANFIQFQRERFDTFKRRVDFLSDTAGAVGLLGTVWGMFALFSSGNVSDKQAILSGMGTALISTLLGLVVSITLNLISTEVYSFFDNRIDQIEEEADKLRFRLMELNLSENGSQSSSSGSSPSGDASSQADGRGNRTAQPASDVPDPASSKEKISEGITASEGAVTESQTTSDAQTKTETIAEPSPHHLRFSGVPESGTAGSVLRNIELKVTSEDGTPIADEEVRLRTLNGSGKVGDGERETSRRTDEQGEVSFDWSLPVEVGTNQLEADVTSSEAPGTTRRLSVKTQAGTPTQYAQDGNNQGAKLGNDLSKPLVLRLFDDHGNPVPNQPVEFQVRSGEGTFEGGAKSKKVSTDGQGKAAVSFSVGNEPGVNVIVASTGEEEVKFQAMALEG